jgi:putative ABC transport system permease protein
MNDLRLAARSLRKAPGFTAVAVLTLALGLGANTAIFSVVNAVLLRPLPYPAADRLVAVWGARGSEKPLLVSIPNVEDWRRRSHSFEDIGIMRAQSVNLTGVDAPDRLTGSFVTASTLSILGAHAARGRLFTAAESTRGTAAEVAVLSYQTWATRFGSDPSVIGRPLTLDGRPREVIGVMAPDYRDPIGAIDVWLPVTSAPSPGWFLRENANVWAFGRLKPGVTLATAQRELTGISAQLAAEYPAADAGLDADIIPLRDQIVGPIGTKLLTVLAFVGVVLLIACANVANLQLARATARRPELVLRGALGAGSWRLLRQLLAESLVLAVLGGAAGLGVALLATQSLVASVPGGVPAFGQVGVDGPVLAFCALLTLGTGVVFGAMPALRAARADAREALNERAPSGRRGGLDSRDVLVAAQLALCTVLLVGAGLLARSLLALQRTSPGFNPHDLLAAEFRLPRAKYQTPEQIVDFMTRALAQVRTVPGVHAAALVRSEPLSGNWGGVTYQVEGQPEHRVPPATLENTISDGFFQAMQIPLLQGRDFNDRDRAATAPVAIVSQELARRAWPGASPLGKRLKLIGPPDTWVTVVGVVGNITQRTLGEPLTPELYRPLVQDPGIFTAIEVRTRGDPADYAHSIRAAIWSVDPDQPVWRMTPVERFVAENVAAPRFTLLLAGTFALLAVLLAAVGVYGVMSYALAQRTRELGIRVALGARQSQVVGTVLRHGLLVVGCATPAGLAAALAAARLLRSQLVGVGPDDPVTLVAVPLVLGGIALLACYLPARRAARVDPMEALRHE